MSRIGENERGGAQKEAADVMEIDQEGQGEERPAKRARVGDNDESGVTGIDHTALGDELARQTKCALPSDSLTLVCVGRS